ncbi:MAG: TonB-dependent receptor domain-containing protein [Blastocatellia bacterium]
MLLLILIAQTYAQIQIGSVRGVVSDQANAAVPGARISLINPLTGNIISVAADGNGAFTIHNLPFDHYRLRVDAGGFASEMRGLTVQSNLPVVTEIRLRVAAAAETINISATGELLETGSTSTRTAITENQITRAPRVNRNRQLQEIVSSTPGWATENNGLIHVRGVDDGVLYVIDGIPIADRVDAVSAATPDVDSINALNVITGNFPAEFGGRSGAVVVVNLRSGLDDTLHGTVRTGYSDFQTRDIGATLAGAAGKRFGFFLSGSTAGSHRFLDPVDPRNFHNHGGAASFNLRTDWQVSARDTMTANLSVNGSRFAVPNDELQQLTGQNQRQELRNNSQSLGWQRVWSARTVSNIAFFHRDYHALLHGSEHDIPIAAEQDRRHARMGLIASLTHQRGGHTMKFGVETARVTPREYFRFFITDEEEAEEREVSEQALEFDDDDPFVFRDRRTGGQFSAYAQDQFAPLRNLTVSAGLRFDHNHLLVTDRQLSPRIGAVYHLPASRTAIRASFNRLFQPPQVDNLLLSASPQARQLSPFTDRNAGGAAIHAERVSAYEIGFAQDVRGWFRLDGAWWRRDFRNVGDPNVFFNTTVIFPNSVARGHSRGLDARLDVPERRGVGFWLSYTNMILNQTGPINGGLFLTGEFIEIGPGTKFIPDQDQRNTGAFGLTYNHRRSGLFLALTGRHESGVPLEVEEERLDDLRHAPGSFLVDFNRGRVRPRTIFNLSAAYDLSRRERFGATLQFDILNLADKLFAWNFGNPFEGTHFGYGRRVSAGLKITIR